MNTATMSTDTQAQLQHINPNTLLLPTTWENPRSDISDADYNDLLSSIKAKGVHTPVAARYVEGGIEVVAGFTRRRAAIEAGLMSIPCLVRNMTDEQAYSLAVSENTDRTQMSQLDTARGLKRIVSNHNGDLNAAAAEMGWSKAKFDQALQLLRSSDHVQSLIGKKQENGFVLSVAHAARLSALPEDVQDKIVVAVIRDKMSVLVLKEKIQKAVKRPLASAAFCQSECEKCPFNTQVQVSLFADDSGSDCTNPSCFTQKTEQHFEAKKVELEKEYGKLVLLSTVDSPIAIGSHLVGDKQYNEGCLSCDKHCAILADKGLKQGQILENQCLDKACANKHVNDLKSSMSKATTTTQTTSTAPITGASTDKAQGKATQPKATSNVKAEPPKRLVLESQTALCESAKPLVMDHPSYFLAMSLAALKAQEKGSNNVESDIISLMEKTPQELEQMMVQSIENITLGNCKESLNIERTMIKAAQKHSPSFTEQATRDWLPTETRLKDMTKAIRQQVLSVSGFANAYQTAHSEKEYNALLNKKTDEQVKAIMAFDFDWSGFAPDYYLQAIKTQKYNY